MHIGVDKKRENWVYISSEIFHLIQTTLNPHGSCTGRSGLSKPECWVPPPLVSMAMDLNQHLRVITETRERQQHTLGFTCPEIEAMRADISFRRAPNIWKKGTWYSLSSSSVDIESYENAPFCHLFCCRAALRRALIKFRNQRGQGDYPGSFHHLVFLEKEIFEIFNREEGWLGLRRSGQ